MADRFDDIIKHTLKWEGGYVNDVHDPGGETKYGISKRSYPKIDIARLSIKDATSIYYRDYWVSPGIYKIKYTPLAAKVFDLGVNTGPKRAIRFLQEVINKFGYSVAVDGIMGERTLAAIDGVGEKVDGLLIAYLQRYEEYYTGLNRPRYIKGWLKRLYS